MKILSVAVVVLISTVGMVESPKDSLVQVQELISAPSFVPEEELYTHIAGGYFSSYDMKTGECIDSERLELPALNLVVIEKNTGDKGSVKIILTELNYSSRFVYLPKGELILVNGSGEKEIFSLEKLDYVQVEGSEIPAYRLSAENLQNNKNATLISTSIGTEIPQLVGTLYVEINKKVVSYEVRICGRNNFDQENHLCKKIESVSNFKSEPEGLSFGPGTTEEEKSQAEKAFSKAKSVYQNLGFDLTGLNSPIVYFGSPLDWEEDVLENTIALFNNVKKYILMTPFDSDTYQENNILGTYGNLEVFNSILFHEFCHHISNWINPEIAPHHDEFIACALQLATLSDSLLDQVIDEFGSFTFESRNDITLLAYISTPKPFQVASYLYGSSHAGQLRLLIQNSQYMIRDPFLVSRL